MAGATELLQRHPSGERGLTDPVHDAQAVFRAVLEAMARPGSARSIAACCTPPAPLPIALAAVALTLLDHETAIWLSPSLLQPSVRDYLALHAGARLTVDASAAAFVVCASPDEIPALTSLAQGTPDYPDRSATVLVALPPPPVHAAQRVTLSGPGIDGTRSLALTGLDATFWRAARVNHALYPLGVDFIFCRSGAVIALPRSTRIEV